MRDFRYSLVRKQAIKTGDQNHWFKRDKKLMTYVLDRIRAEGPLMAKDFKHTDHKSRDWSFNPAKQALENLFMQGDLMVPRRHNFHKVYDLTERVLPSTIDQSVPTQAEYARFLIQRFLQAHGLGSVQEITYLLKTIKSTVSQVAEEMAEAKELIEVSVNNKRYYALLASLELLNNRRARKKLTILSPFDNLLIQRQRMRDLFDFDYQLECYVPVAKRKYGYFALPLLWNGELVARMDCKVDRKQQILYINNLSIEPRVNTDKLMAALSAEIPEFMSFNGCKETKRHQSAL